MGHQSSGERKRCGLFSGTIRGALAPADRNRARSELWLGNSVPGIEALVKVCPLSSDTVPECRICRFEKARPPSGDGKLASGPQQRPERLDRFFHVRHKKDSEDTDDRVETGNRQAEIKHISYSKLDIPEGAFSCLGLGKLNQVFGKIDGT